MRLRLFSALLCAGLLFCSSLGAQASGSTTTSPLSEPLWQALLPIATTLPNSYDSFIASLQSQVSTLTDNNSSLSSSNLELLASNNSLTLENAALKASLKASQDAEQTSEAKSTLLQRDLSDSIASTTRAQADAKALEAENGLLKIGAVGLGAAAVSGAVYIIGHALGAWK